MPAGPVSGPSPDSRLALQTLGGAALHALRPGEPPRLLLDAGKPLAVVTYLALTPERAASRSRLVDLLWSNVESEAARNSLRVALSLLRRRLGPHAFGDAPDPVTLIAPVESDRDALLAAWERQDVEAVVDLYAGDFLPAFASPGGAGFEQCGVAGAA
jgi:DNA-binding SARP family transcriptional activator